MKTNDEIKKCICELYETFSSYPKPLNIEGCECCNTKEDVDQILSKSLRNLEPPDIVHFCFSGLLTFGNVNDFKYLLPRILEIVATQLEELHVDVEIIFAKFKHAEWFKWQSNEIKAVRNFFFAFWRQRKSYYVNPDNNIFSCDELLCSLGQCEDDLIQYLDCWVPAQNVEAIKNLSEFISENTESLISTKKLSNSFWLDRSFQMEQIIEWMLSDSLLLNVESYLKEFTESFVESLDRIKYAFGRLPKN
jgi:hypothetical protein